MFSKDLAAVVSNPHDKQEIVSILPYFELSYPDGQAVELKYGLTFSQMVPIRQETKSRIEDSVFMNPDWEDRKYHKSCLAGLTTDLSTLFNEAAEEMTKVKPEAFPSRYLHIDPSLGHDAFHITCKPDEYQIQGPSFPPSVEYSVHSETPQMPMKFGTTFAVRQLKS